MAIGIDFGTHSIKIARAEMTGKGAKIISFKVIETGGMDPENISDALKSYFKTAKIPRSPAVVSLPSQQALLRELLVPFTRDDQIAKTIKFNAEPLLQTTSLDKVLLSYYKSREISGKSKLLLAAVPKEVVKNTLQVCTKAQLDPEQIDLDVTSLFNILHYGEHFSEEESHIVVDIGNTTVKILLVDKGNLRLIRSMHFRTIESWMDQENITEDSYEAFKRAHAKVGSESSVLDETGESSSVLATSSLTGRKGAVGESSEIEALGATPEASGIFELYSDDEEEEDHTAAFDLYESGEDLEATGMFELYSDDDISLEDLDELGVESSAEMQAYSDEWDVNKFLGEDILGDEDSEIVLTESEIINAQGQVDMERVPIVVLLDDEFEALDIYDDFEEVSESAMEKFYRRIFQEVERSLVYAGFRGDIEEIYLTGGGSNLPGLAGRFQEHFGVAVSLPNMKSLASKPTKDFQEVGLVAAGLAMKGLKGKDYDKTQFNFRQEEFQYQKKFEKAKKTISMTLFLIFLLLFVTFQALKEKLKYQRFQTRKAQVSQLKVYKYFFPDDEPTYNNNIPASIDEQLEQVRAKIGEGKEVPKLLSVLDIFRDITQAKQRSRIPNFKLRTLNISQTSIQLSGKIKNNYTLGLLADAFGKSKYLEVQNYNFANGIGTILLIVKKQPPPEEGQTN